MSSSLRVDIVPILTDNYSYVLSRSNVDRCVVVDPGDAKPIIKHCKESNLIPSQIWLTHHHKDHVAGVEELCKQYQCEVFGPKAEVDKLPHLHQQLSELDLFHFGSHKVKIFETPGHTLGHIVYWLYEDDVLFCGDTLFSLGCGRVFEGTYQQMWNSLCKLRTLPKQTHIFCGHEYTQQNGQFALSVDPNNQALKTKCKKAEALIKKHKPTLPSLLEDEILTNPFLRADLPYWKESLNAPNADPVEIFEILRTKKDEA